MATIKTISELQRENVTYMDLIKSNMDLISAQTERMDSKNKTPAKVEVEDVPLFTARELAILRAQRRKRKGL